MRQSVNNQEQPSVASPASFRLRHWLVLWHRYVGLCIAIFVVVASLTGSVLVFQHELDAQLNPQLFRIQSKEAPLDPFVLRERVQASLEGVRVNEVKFDLKPGHSLKVSGSDEREYYIDPTNAQVLGSRKWGDLTEGLRLNIIPFIFSLHYSLALGDVGIWLFGIVALLWTIDTFVGAYLTFPVGKKSASGSSRPWVNRWGTAWLMKTGQLFSTIFTFHRAAGLWLWSMLFVFAWSAVGFNLNPVFKPVMSIIGYEDAWDNIKLLKTPLTEPKLDFRAAHQLAQTMMQAEAQHHGFIIKKEGELNYDPGYGLYNYGVYSSRDLGDRWPEARLFIDGNTGAKLGLDLSTGEKTGNTIAHWLFALHMGVVGGLPYRVLVVVLGLVFSLLAASGVWIWWRKRKKKTAVA
jgi:uncharacterized iron-regulated membrane protein